MLDKPSTLHINVNNMRFFTTALLLVFLSACEVAPAESRVETSPEVDTLVEQVLAHKVLIGTPEGEPVLFEPSGVYTAAEESDPAVIAAREALGVLAITLGDLAATAQSWDEARLAISGYVTSPPDEVRALPSYVIEQVAAQTLYNHFETDFLAPENAEASLPYVEFLIDGRYPDPTPVYRYVSSAGDELPLDRKQRMVSEALQATEHYEREIRASEASIGCTDCLLRQSGIDASWSRAKTGLEGLAF